MADEPRLPSDFITITCKHPGNPVHRRYTLIAYLRGGLLGFFVGTKDECKEKEADVRAAFPEAGDTLTFEVHPDTPWGEPQHGEVPPIRLPADGPPEPPALTFNGPTSLTPIRLPTRAAVGCPRRPRLRRGCMGGARGRRRRNRRREGRGRLLGRAAHR